MNYLIININQIEKINFNQVYENSKNTVRKSVDNTHFIVKYAKSNTPSFLQNLENYNGPYSKEQILPILNSSMWKQTTI